jgi:hypothetical protein
MSLQLPTINRELYVFSRSFSIALAAEIEKESSEQAATSSSSEDYSSVTEYDC